MLTGEEDENQRLHPVVSILVVWRRLLCFHSRNLWHSRLAQASSGLFLVYILAGILGYAFQVVMGRWLSPADYGVLSALLALLMVLGVPLGTVGMVVTRRFAEYRVNDDRRALTALYWRIHWQVAVAGVLGTVLLFACIPWLRVYLHVSSPWPVVWFAVLMLCSLFAPLSHALLQGMQDFRRLGSAVMQWGAGKLLFPLVLVGAGLGLNGALLGLIFNGLLSWVVAFAMVRRYMMPDTSKNAALPLSLRANLPILLANICFAVMTQLDMVLVNYYFPGDLAGNYAAAAVLGKVVLFLPGGIVAALFPMVAENEARGHSSISLFMGSVGMTVLTSGLAALFFFLFADPVIELFFGNKYSEASQVLRYFGFAMLPMALVMVAEYFLIAKGRVLFAYLFLVAAPCQIVAIHFFHDSLLQVVLVMTVCGGLLTLVGYSLMWRDYQR